MRLKLTLLALSIAISLPGSASALRPEVDTPYDLGPQPCTLIGIVGLPECDPFGNAGSSGNSGTCSVVADCNELCGAMWPYGPLGPTQCYEKITSCRMNSASSPKVLCTCKSGHTTNGKR